MISLSVDLEDVLDTFEGIRPTKYLMRGIGAAMSGPIMDYQRDNAPRDTGKLIKSIKTAESDVTKTTITVEVGPTVDYAVYVEFGTGVYAENGDGRTTPWVYQSRGEFYTTTGMRAQPFIRRSASDPGVQLIANRNVRTVITEFIEKKLLMRARRRSK